MPLLLQRTLHLLFFVVRLAPWLQHPKPRDSAMLFMQMFCFAAVAIAVLACNCLWYWWISSLLSMIPAAYALYPLHIQGLLIARLLLGVLVSEFCFSGQLSDVIVQRLASKNSYVRVAKMRLWLIYLAAALIASKFLLQVFFSSAKGSFCTN